jgi:thiosulfate reductase cytochrome b subunit
VYPLQGIAPPSWLRIGGWLEGGRQWYFAFAWFLILSGAVYLSYFFVSGEWRRRPFLPRRDLTNAVLMFLYYARVRSASSHRAASAGLLQRTAATRVYTSAITFGIAMVLSGLAIYKPVKFQLLTALFGGYDAARAIHLGVLCLLTLFVAMHLVLVALHPRELLNMITGGKRG